MKVSLSTIREKVKASFTGKMAEFTMECGKMESSTEEAHLQQKMDNKELESGKKVERSNGFLE